MSPVAELVCRDIDRTLFEFYFLLGYDMDPGALVLAVRVCCKNGIDDVCLRQRMCNYFVD